MEEYHRNNDKIASRIEQKLDDHIDRFNRFEKDIIEKFEKHLAWSESEEKNFLKKVDKLELAWLSIETPVKWVGWAVTVFLAVLITSLTTYLTEWSKNHWTK